MPDADLRELTTRFQRDGFVHAPSVLTAAEIDVYGRAVDHAVATRKRRDARALHEKSLYEQSFIQCEYVWEDFPDIRGLTFHPRICEIAAALIEAPTLRLWHDQALYKEAGGRETDPHQDHPYWPITQYDTVTVWIPFIPVDTTTGCMGYVPGSHLGELEYVDIFEKPGSGQALLERQTAEPVFVPCQTGDVIYHHGRTVHLAGPNRSAAMRRVYTSIYFRDGATRSDMSRHASVDRPRIGVGEKIESYATPVVWPLPDGRLPEPGPWPDMTDDYWVIGRELGAFPDEPGGNP
jgi:ectoine hydroxylase-related dioxygenase (phytanoyl-CoA dioxygenase family)